DKPGLACEEVLSKAISIVGSATVKSSGARLLPRLRHWRGIGAIWVNWRGGGETAAFCLSICPQSGQGSLLCSSRGGSASRVAAQCEWRNRFGSSITVTCGVRTGCLCVYFGSVRLCVMNQVRPRNARRG